MTSGRIGWLMSWLSVLALILTVATPQRATAAPMTSMMQISNCTDCPEEAPVPGKAAGHQAKALPCSPIMCVGAFAAVLPALEIINRPVWHPTAYTPGLLADPNGRSLAPEPIPPKPSVQA